jgi:hypothetical protein
LNESPAGSGVESANEYGVVPPLAVTGVNAGIAVFTVPTVAATAWVVVSAELTVRLNVFAD